MRHTLATALTWMAGRISGKATVTTSTGTSEGFLDAYRKHRQPTSGELLQELKNTAWTCASINAATCASNPPKLYVKTLQDQSRPKCQTKALSATHPLTRGKAKVEEVTEHPLLDLLAQVNPVHNAFDLWETTELYLEVFGCAYWLLERHGFAGTPSAIWILPSQNVTPRRHPGSPNVVDCYDYRTTLGTQSYAPEEIIHFRFPDPRDPYNAGLSPLKACYEQVALVSQYTAMKRTIYDNTGIPSVVLAPGEVIGEDERKRLETEYSQKFRRGGQGKALVTEGATKVTVLSHSMGDLAALAEARATKEDIANAFHIPIPYLTGDTNLANMEAAEIFHMRLAITPRLRRRDEKINERLIPLYDPSGRLFVASEDPTPSNKALVIAQENQDITNGVRTINEVRADRGLPPVPWGDAPLGKIVTFETTRRDEQVQA